MRHCIFQLATVTATAALAALGNVAAAAEHASTTDPVPGVWPNPTEWRQRHEGFVAAAIKDGVDVLFLGDSITDFWRRSATETVPTFLPEGGGRAVWDKTFARLKAANFGSCGEGTQHVLWRVRNGRLDAILPKLVVLMIGVNNLAMMGNSCEEVAGGIKAIVREIHARTPTTKVLLLGLYPHLDEALMGRIRQVNAIVARLDDGGATVKFMDLGDRFRSADRTLKSVMPDGCHPNAKGYQVVADAILPTVRMMIAPERPLRAIHVGNSHSHPLRLWEI
jgi:lysophospholipase L1-like esterase